MPNKTSSIQPQYLILDIETSGLNPVKHGLLQVAALALDTNLDIIGQYNEYIKPPDSVIFDSIADSIHRIPREVTNQGLSYSEFSEHFIDWVTSVFGSTKPTMIGQFFVFDYNFLAYVIDNTLGDNPMIKETDKDNYGLFQAVLSRNFIDTKSMVTMINTKCQLEGRESYFPITSLSAAGGLKDKLGIDISNLQAHDALDDCRATREVLIKLLELINVKL
jgi:DNA polymerase III epsilon subunit-like protein